MAWNERGPRKGARRLPERLRRKVLANSPHCFFGFADICEWPHGRKEVHHIKEACEFEDPDDPEIDAEHNLVGACKRCHTRHSAQQAQKRSVAKQNEWRRKRQTMADVPRR